jgi:chorismate-pyruvate lyase
MADSLRSWNLMHVLSERLLQANSATAELERWCRDNAIGDGRIVALCDRDARPEPLDDESLEAIYPQACLERMRFRRVRLATAGIVIVDALNWFFPDALTPEICGRIDTTDVPFGRAIAHLNPRRRTFLVRRRMPDQSADAGGAIDPASIAFEHRAVVYRDDGVPLAVVHERFRAMLAMRVPELAPTSFQKSQTRPLAGGEALDMPAQAFRKHPHDFDVVSCMGATTLAASQSSRR